MYVCIQDAAQNIRTVHRDILDKIACPTLSQLEDGEILIIDQVHERVVENMLIYLNMKSSGAFESCAPSYFERIRTESLLSNLKALMASLGCAAFETDANRFVRTQTDPTEKLRMTFKSKLKL
jgi:hypothetical protein